MVRNLWFVIIVLILISGCSPAAPATSIPINQNATATSSLIPTGTTTSLPTETPSASASITPLPTITPKVECPVEHPEKRFIFDVAVHDQSIYKQILDFLNAGGTHQAVITAYRQKYNWANNRFIQERDVTGDSISDLLFTDDGLFVAYVCKEKQYQVKFLLGETYHDTRPEIITVKAMNLDGVNQIIAIEGDERIRIVSVFEWNGDDFRRLNNDDKKCSDLYGPSWAEALDTDGNGSLELVLEQAIPTWSEYYDGLPWRKENRTCVWNGKQFVLAKIELAPPEYRFQAIQDGDSASSQKEFDTALRLYQAVIFSKKLKSYSPEIHDNLRANLESQIGPNPLPTPTPYPNDITEYPRLAAYAYYRIMLLHLVQNHEPEATTVYNTLQQKFGSDPYGHPYVEMATTFWEAYQSTRKMYDGCAAAIQYAAEHPEILTPLGSDYHGAQSHIYVPVDVCPFR